MLADEPDDSVYETLRKGRTVSGSFGAVAMLTKEVSHLLHESDSAERA